MEIVGRTTADAVINETKAGKKVVNFSIAINDTYKTKGTNEVQKVVTYVNCSYWLNTAVAAYLTKGTLVECAGRIAANAWITREGEAKAALTFTAGRIKLHGGAAGKSSSNVGSQHPSTAMAEPSEDLPF